MPSFKSKKGKRNKGVTPSTSSTSIPPQIPAPEPAAPVFTTSPSQTSISQRESPFKKLLRRSTSNINSSWKEFKSRRKSDASLHGDSPGRLTGSTSRLSDSFADRSREEGSASHGAGTPLRPQKHTEQPHTPTSAQHHRLTSSLSSVTQISPSPTSKHIAKSAIVRPSPVAVVETVATSRGERSSAGGDVLGLTGFAAVNEGSTDEWARTGYATHVVEEISPQSPSSPTTQHQSAAEDDEQKMNRARTSHATHVVESNPHQSPSSHNTSHQLTARNDEQKIDTARTGYTTNVVESTSSQTPLSSHKILESHDIPSLGPPIAPFDRSFIDAEPSRSYISRSPAQRDMSLKAGTDDANTREADDERPRKADEELKVEEEGSGIAFQRWIGTGSTALSTTEDVATQSHDVDVPPKTPSEQLISAKIPNAYSPPAAIDIPDVFSASQKPINQPTVPVQSQPTLPLESSIPPSPHPYASTPPVQSIVSPSYTYSLAPLEPVVEESRVPTPMQDAPLFAYTPLIRGSESVVPRSMDPQKQGMPDVDAQPSQHGAKERQGEEQRESKRRERRVSFSDTEKADAADGAARISKMDCGLPRGAQGAVFANANAKTDLETDAKSDSGKIAALSTTSDATRQATPSASGGNPIGLSVEQKHDSSSVAVQQATTSISAAREEDSSSALEPPATPRLAFLEFPRSAMAVDDESQRDGYRAAQTMSPGVGGGVVLDPTTSGEGKEVFVSEGNEGARMADDKQGRGRDVQDVSTSDGTSDKQIRKTASTEKNADPASKAVNRETPSPGTPPRSRRTSDASTSRYQMPRTPSQRFEALRHSRQSSYNIAPEPDDASLHEARTAHTAFCNRSGIWVGMPPVPLDSVAIKTYQMSQQGSSSGVDPTDNLGEGSTPEESLVAATAPSVTQPPMLPFIPRLFAPRLTLEFKWADRILPTDVTIAPTSPNALAITGGRSLTLFESLMALAPYGENFVQRKRVGSRGYGGSA